MLNDIIFDTKESWIKTIVEYQAPAIQRDRVWRNRTEQSHGETDLDKIKAELTVKINKDLQKQMPAIFSEIFERPQLFLLHGKVSEWNNNWRNCLNEGFPFSLENLILANHRLEGIDLSYAYLGRPATDTAFIDHTNVNLSHAKLQFTCFEHRGMYNSNLSNADCTRAYFLNTYLRLANFNNATLDYAVFDYADLTNADFSNASLRGASFYKARLEGAKFDNADLTDTRFLELDDNSFHHTKFSVPPGSFQQIVDCLRVLHQTQFDAYYRKRNRGISYFHLPYDKWTLLREEYTGVKGSMILLFTLFFITPYIIKAILYKGIGSLELQTKVFVEAKEYRVWEIILGLDKNSLSYTTLVVLLIVYNLMRFILTSRISKLKEREIRNQKSPKLSEYKHLFSIHLIVVVLSVFSLIFLITNIVTLLFSKVYLP